MKYSKVIVTCLILFVATKTINCWDGTANSTVDVRVIENLTDADAFLVESTDNFTQKVSNHFQRASITYNLGDRRNCTFFSSE